MAPGGSKWGHMGNSGDRQAQWSERHSSPGSSGTRWTIEAASRSRCGSAARLAQGATLARWLDGCLAIFPADTWEDLAARIQGLPTTNAAARQFGRFMSSGAVEVELDRQGRRTRPELPARVRRPDQQRGGRGRRAEPARDLGADAVAAVSVADRGRAGGARRAPRRPGHLTVPRPLMRLRADRPAVRHTRCNATWEKGTCRSWSTRFSPRWPSVPAAPWRIARSAAVGTPSGFWRPRLRVVACSASMPIRRPLRRRNARLERFGDRVALRHANFESIYDVAVEAGSVPAGRRPLRPRPQQLPARRSRPGIQLRGRCAAGHEIR